VPPPSATSPSTWAFIRAVRSNSLTLFPAEAYEKGVWVRRFLGRQSVLLNAPDAIQRVLVDNPGNYRRSGAAVRILLPTNGQGLVLSEGETWRHQRRTIAPALTPRVIPMVSRHVASAVEEQFDEWSTRRGETVDLLAAMQFLALEIIGRSMFSVQMRQYGGEVRRLLAEFAAKHVRLDILDMLMPPTISTPRDFGRRRWRRVWMRLVETILQARQAASGSDETNDLYGLLHGARDPQTGAGLAPQELRDQVATMLLAGSETTALNMFWALTLLAQAPDEQQRVADEASALALTPDSAGDDLARLPRTRAVVMEALRLYPPAYTLVREAIGPDSAGAATLKRNDIIMIAPWVLGRHRALWQRPQVFDPSRFIPGAPPPPRHAFLPFGAGPRTCIGAQFALTESTLVVASIIRRFRVTLAEDRPVLPQAILATAPDHSPPFRLEPR
jgi:cytochrome P450